MSKINYNRLREKKWKMPFRHPFKPDRAIDPETLYDRAREKDQIKEELEELYEDSDK